MYPLGCPSPYPDSVCLISGEEGVPPKSSGSPVRGLVVVIIGELIKYVFPEKS